MEIVTKAYELCAAVKTIKIKEGSVNIKRGKDEERVKESGIYGGPMEICPYFSLAYKAPIFTLATFANGALRK